VVIGLGVYTGAFTPPTSALALTQSSGTNISAITAGQTQLLLPLNVSPFADSSTNALTVTNTGTVVPGVQYPFTSTDATGTYTVTTRNANSSMAWSSTAGGIFRKTTNNTADFLTFGPNYSSTSQAYTVMMVYRSQAGTAGRLLNANTADPDWLMGLWGSGAGVQDIFYNGAFVGSNSTAQNGSWRFGWFTFDGSASTNAYAAGNTHPTSAHGTRAGNGGFNGLRLFGRFVDSTTNTEVVTADVGLVKVWDGVLTLAQIQAQHAVYKTRFGY